MSRALAMLLAWALTSLGCDTRQTCLAVGVNYAGSRQGIVLVTGTSTEGSGLQFFAPLAAVPPSAGVVGATVCGGSPKGDTVLVVAWLDDGGTAPLCTLPLTSACSPPPGAPQASTTVTEPAYETTTVHLVIYDPDGG